MASKNFKRAAGVVALLVMAGVLLAAANMLAGVLFFLSYKSDPSNASFLTIERAWMQSATDALMRKKVIGCLIVSSLVVLGGPFSLIMAYKRRPNNLHGEARFATSEDLEKEKLLAPAGILLGKHEDRLVRLGGSEFTMLAAPTRTGKGVGFVIPNLLTFPHSAVVLDIKGENFNLTSAFRRQHLENEVFYFNPFSENSHRWNPLSYVSQDPDFRVKDLMALAALLYPTADIKDPFWPSSAQNLFVGLALLIIESPGLPKTFGEILRQASGKGGELSEYLRRVIEIHRDSGKALSSICTDALNRYLSNSEQVAKGILSTFTAPLTPWTSPLVDKATSGDDFDLRNLRKKKVSIYLHIPAGEVLQAGFIVNLFFSQLINENVKELPEDNKALQYQCLLMLDEFTAMGKVPIIAKGVGYMAGYNLRLAIIVQDPSQLRSVYGEEDAHNIITNMGATIYFTPSTVKDSEEYSKLIGNQTVRSYSNQRSNVGGLNVGKYSLSETESLQSRALMLPQELRELSKELELIVRSGIPVIKADKIRYYDDDFFMQRFESVPNETKIVGGEPRVLPKAVRVPNPNWAAFRSQTSRSDFYMIEDPLPRDTDIPTDLLLEGINDPATPEAEKDSMLQDLARIKLAEWMNDFANVSPASEADALRFERGEVEESQQL